AVPPRKIVPLKRYWFARKVAWIAAFVVCMIIGLLYFSFRGSPPNEVTSAGISDSHPDKIASIPMSPAAMLERSRPARSLKNGTSLTRSLLTAGYGELIIENDTNQDAIVNVVLSGTESLIRSVYV